MKWPFRGFPSVPLKAKAPRPAQPPPADPFLAHIDEVAGGKVRGWAARRDPETRPIEVAVAFDGTRPVPCDATLFRDDLLRAGFGDGRLSFAVQLPLALEAGAETVKLVVRTGAGEQVAVARSLVGLRDETEKTIVFLEFSDLLVYMKAHRNISGIQRVQCGFLLHLAGAVRAGYEYRLCCRNRGDLKFREVPDHAFKALLAAAFDAENLSWGWWMRQVDEFWASLSLPIACRDGDILVVLGAPWAVPDHNLLVAALKRSRNVRYVQLLYDVIPLTAAEYVDETLVVPFAEAVAGLVAHGDHVFAISEYTRREFVGYCARHAISPPPSSRIEMGGTILDAVGGERAGEADGDELDVTDDEFVLCVGTIEPRKNHQLLFNVWRKMLQERPRSSVPKLVLVGRIGWNVESLERHLRFSNYLDGTIIHLSEISDLQLKRLYDRCLFTVFPSFYEGWGLPITESLSYGKLCVASETTSMREAGGEHALYIDPLDFRGVHATITALLDDRALLAEKTRRIRETYRPASWEGAAAALDRQVAALVQDGRPAPAGPSPAARLRVATRYGFARVPSPDADGAFAGAMRRVALAEVLGGGEWYEPEEDVSWSWSPQPRLRFAVDGCGGEDLVCYLSLRLWSPEPEQNVKRKEKAEVAEMSVAVSVDGGPAAILRFDPTGSCHCSIALPGAGGPETGERTIAFSVDRTHPVWEGAVRSESDRRVLGLGLVSLYLCRDLAEEKLGYFESGIVRPVDRRTAASAARP